MEGNTCFLTAGGSTEIVVLALFLLFPIDTVIFGEQSPFRQSSSGRWQNQTISDSFPSLLSLREGVSWLTIDSQSNHGQEHQTDVGCTSYPHETTKRWISLKRVNQKNIRYVCILGYLSSKLLTCTKNVLGIPFLWNVAKVSSV